MNICKMDINAAGLSYRTDQLLDREIKAFSGMINSLKASKSEEVVQELDYDILLESLDSEEDWQAYTAAFLAGRCSCNKKALNKQIVSKLEGLSSKQIPSDVAIEVAMSLVLKGEIKKGEDLLKQLAHSKEPLGNQYKAAFYLAQTGDISCYPIFVEALNNDIPHYRLMAMRHLLAFAPFDGQEVNGMKVNVKDLLLAKIKDTDESVRSEVPFYLEELKIPDLQNILKDIMQNDSSLLVKAAAEMVLERN